MGITILWDNEAKTTLRLDFEGQWSWAQYDKAITEASATIKSAERGVDVIHNLLEGSRMPLGYFLPHFQSALKLMETNLGSIVIVGGSHSMRILLAMFIETFTALGGKVTFTNSLAEARTILAEQRQKVSIT